MKSINFGEIIRSFPEERQTSLVDFIVDRARGLNSKAGAALDEFLGGYSGPIDEDLQESFLAMINAAGDEAFGVSFTVGFGSSKQSPERVLMP
jgi:hypothetical protein